MKCRVWNFALSRLKEPAIMSTKEEPAISDLNSTPKFESEILKPIIDLNKPTDNGIDLNVEADDKGEISIEEKLQHFIWKMLKV